ncbi:MAG TPA: PDZ domain-containing protein, partial [Stellaceae bacterium]|nr:PDZ domain-containing protein [Stellaceae bacterium]
QSVTPAIAKSMNLPNDHGALVADVTKDSPAQKAGFKQGDVIESFNGHQIEKLRDLPIMVAETPVGTDAKVQVRRQGKDVTLEAKIVEQPANLDKLASNDTEQQQPSAKPERASALGLKLQPLTPELRRQLKVPAHVKGVVVSSIDESSPLADVDLQPGDVIVAVNQQPVTSTQEAASKLKAVGSSHDKNLLLQINRHGMNAFVAWSGQSDNG